MAGKPMIISTNMTIDEMINAYSQRFFSRVIGSCDRLDFIGEDVRQLKNT
jgi:DNA replication protein DnaC